LARPPLRYPSVAAKSIPPAAGAGAAASSSSSSSSSFIVPRPLGSY